MDYEQFAAKLIELAGGAGNIKRVAHCATRLRFYTRDLDKADIETMKKTKPVLGVFLSGEEIQIILGQNLIPTFEAAVKLSGAEVGATIDENLDAPKSRKKENPVMKAVNFIAAAMTPMVPALIGGGMMKVFLLLITLVVPSFKAGQTYALLSMVANVPFFFMPIFVAYGAASKLGATPIYSMAVAAALVYPDFISLVAKGEAIHIVGLPVMLIKYSSSMLPALLISICAYYAEKFFNKVVPGIFKSIFVGMGTMTVSYILGLTILGPLGDIVGSYVVNIFLFANDHFGFLAVGFLAACLPWLVMTGMHHAVSPFMAQSIASLGFDGIFRPAYLLHNMSEGGACLGVALRTKDKEFKSQCFSLAVGCILAGVTEPAIYGVNFRLKKPMLGVMAGGAAGGCVAGALGAKAYVMGYSNVMALPIFMDTMGAMAIAIVTSIAVAAVVTFFLGFDESDI